MLCYPNAKINIGLAITGCRPDGYHSIETIFCPIALSDALEIEPSEDTNDSLYISGLPLAHNPTDNLVMKALTCIRTICTVPPTNVALYKAIPMGAGLGGGSADAAFMLHLINDRYALGLSKDTLQRLATSLGADCPFFLYNKPALARGIGQELTPLHALSLSTLRIILIKPPFEISTPEAYNGLGLSRGQTRPGLPPEAIKALLKGDYHTAFPLLRNDFEPSVFARYPRLACIKHELLKQGALISLMSGSGSTIFGVFDSDTQDIDTSPWQDCFLWQGHFL